MWMEYLNTLACLTLLGYALVAAILVSHKGYWGSKLVLLVGVVATGLNCITPWIDEHHQVVPSSIVMHTVMAVLLLLWRTEVMRFMKQTFQKTP